MPDSRKARRQNDPGLQPERTSLAWFRTLLGYGALMALAVRHHWPPAGVGGGVSSSVLALGAGWRGGGRGRRAAGPAPWGGAGRGPRGPGAGGGG
ncbi:hypothetical protein C9E96_00015, partial [Salmonella enterica subsp. enterica serovar Infantis]